MGETKWCPECGAEYGPSSTTCADDGTLLVDRLPSAPSSDGRADSTDEREPVEYDLTDWSEDLRSSLEWMLRGAGIAYDWVEEGVLSVPEARGEEVDGYLDYLAAGSPETDEAASDEWRTSATDAPGAPTELSIDDFYDGDPARRYSDEVEFGLDWSDADGVRCEVSWVHDTGELYLMSGRRWGADMVEILDVLPSREEVDQLLDGWQDAMLERNSVRWVRDRVAKGAMRNEPEPPPTAAAVVDEPPARDAVTEPEPDADVATAEDWWQPPAAIGWVTSELDDVRANYLMARADLGADAALNAALLSLDAETHQRLQEFFEGHMDIVYGNGAGRRTRTQLRDALEREHRRTSRA